VARILLLTALAVLVAGCGDSVPGGKVVSPLPQTVIGKVSTPWTGGNAAAGKAVFLSAGCVACHTFTPAGATGTVGPDLDKLVSLDQNQHGGNLEEFIYGSIVNPLSRHVPGYKNGIMPGTFATTLKPSELADLVAFLAKGP
jgi:mono/diheme cytochrome c family protein